MYNTEVERIYLDIPEELKPKSNGVTLVACCGQGKGNFTCEYCRQSLPRFLKDGLVWHILSYS